MKQCAACHRPVKSPRAKFCLDIGCARARDRERKRSREQSGKPAPDGDRPAGGVFAATLVALAGAGRVDSPAGQNALALAARIDFGAFDTGSSLAALSKQHLAALGEALKDVSVVADGVDELRARRAARA